MSERKKPAGGFPVVNSLLTIVVTLFSYSDCFCTSGPGLVVLILPGDAVIVWLRWRHGKRAAQEVHT